MEEYKRIETDDGAVFETYYKDGKKHRSSGPAVIVSDATMIYEEYWREGRRIGQGRARAPDTPQHRAKIVAGLKAFMFADG